ncbi:MAG TPA: hypothetical protein VG713_11755, partial [Pirellulales bacterium]|nr:hypothetical protein [Pirellulales bacterium]
MPDPRLIERQTDVLHSLERLIRERAEKIAAAEADYKRRHTEATELAERNATAIEAQFQRSRDEAQRSAHKQLHEAAARFEREHGTSQAEYASLSERISQRAKHDKAVAKRAFEEASWETQTVFDATKNKPRREFLEQERQVNARAERLEQIANEAKDFLALCRLYRAPELTPSTPDPSAGEADMLKAFLDRLAQAETLLVELKKLRLPRFFEGLTPFWFMLAVWLAAIYPAGMATGWELTWVPISIAAAIVVGGAIAIWLYQVATRKVRRVFDPLCQMLLDTEGARARWAELGTARWQREAAEIKHRHQTELKRANDKYHDAKTSIRQRRETETAEIEAKYPPRLAELSGWYENLKQTVETETRARLAQLTADYQSQRQAEQQRAAHEQQQIEADRAADARAIAEHWKQGIERVGNEVAALDADTEGVFPDWDSAAWDTWQPPLGVARAVRFGTIDVRLDQLPGAEALGSAAKASLKTAYRLPALLDFPQHASLVLRTAGSGRARAVEVLQAAMLRFLTAVPPGKLR